MPLTSTVIRASIFNDKMTHKIPTKYQTNLQQLFVTLSDYTGSKGFEPIFGEVFKQKKTQKDIDPHIKARIKDFCERYIEDDEEEEGDKVIKLQELFQEFLSFFEEELYCEPVEDKFFDIGTLVDE